MGITFYAALLKAESLVGGISVFGSWTQAFKENELVQNHFHIVYHFFREIRMCTNSKKFSTPWRDFDWHESNTESHNQKTQAQKIPHVFREHHLLKCQWYKINMYSYFSLAKNSANFWEKNQQFHELFQHCLKTEIFFLAFMTKISWKQRLQWFHEIFLRCEREFLFFPYCVLELFVLKIATTWLSGWSIEQK